VFPREMTTLIVASVWRLGEPGSTWVAGCVLGAALFRTMTVSNYMSISNFKQFSNMQKMQQGGAKKGRTQPHRVLCCERGEAV
jgi:hypothetical protein